MLREIAPWCFVAGLSVFILASNAAASGAIYPWEAELYYAINGLSDSWKWPVLAVTQLGSPFIIALLSLTLFIRRQSRLAIAVLLNGGLTYALVAIFKAAIERPRPMFLLGEALERETTVSTLGYPSGHTALATVFALTLLIYLRGHWRWLAPLWIAGVGFSRIYLGVHAPLDIVGGIALGVCVASVQWMATLRRERRKQVAKPAAKA